MLFHRLVSLPCHSMSLEWNSQLQLCQPMHICVSVSKPNDPPPISSLQIARKTSVAPSLCCQNTWFRIWVTSRTDWIPVLQITHCVTLNKSLIYVSLDFRLYQIRIRIPNPQGLRRVKWDDICQVPSTVSESTKCDTVFYGTDANE